MSTGRTTRALLAKREAMTSDNASPIGRGGVLGGDELLACSYTGA